MKREVVRTHDFASGAAALIMERAHAALGERGHFRIALSGGKTPRPVYEELARQDLPWDRMLVTFSDERCVPPEDEQSNYRMAKETLLGNAPPAAVLRMHGELEPALAASQYEQELDALAAQAHERIYEHDVILLGLGDDGHTASLFPGTAALKETRKRVVANCVPQQDSWRLTFTFPLLRAAREIIFLVGANKNADLIEKVWAGDETLPAARVDRQAQHVVWVIGEGNNQ